jgi:hypothetical protein
VNAMNIELTEEEKKILKHAIEVYLSGLRSEIYKTESHTFKPPLKNEKNVLKAIQGKL